MLCDFTTFFPIFDKIYKDFILKCRSLSLVLLLVFLLMTFRQILKNLTLFYYLKSFFKNLPIWYIYTFH